MVKMAHPPAPRVAPTAGTIEQKLAQIVQMINDLQTRTICPTYDHITLTDPSGQTWAVYMQTNGQIRTELVTR